MKTRRREYLLPACALLVGAGCAAISIWQSMAAVRANGERGAEIALTLSALDRDLLAGRQEYQEALSKKESAVPEPKVSPEASAQQAADALDARLRETGGKLDAHLAKLAAMDLPKRAQSSFENFQKRWAAYRQQQAEVVELVRSRKFKEAQELDAAQVTPAFQGATAELQSARAQVGAYLKALPGETQGSMTGIVSGIVLLVVGIGWLGWSLYRRMRAAGEAQVERLATEARLGADRGRVLELTGKNEPLQIALEAFCTMLQGQVPGSYAGVSLFHKGDLKELVSLDLPKDFVERQSCLRHRSELASNRLAVDSDEPVYALIETDAEWHTLRGNALRHEFLSCWSHPIRSSLGQLLGTVDLYLKVARKPDEREKQYLRDGAALAAVAIDHRRLYEELAFQAQRDPLTELPNRRLLQDRLEQVIEKAKRTNQFVAVLMIDLDRFKQVNDLWGHRAGDGVLRTVSQRLQQAAWHADTVARVGGDEFMVVLTQVPSAVGAEQLAERIRLDLCQPMPIDNQHAHISASIGISLFPEDGDDTSTLIRNADLALFQIKSSGKNACQLYRSQMGAVMLRRMSVETGLGQAIRNQEFHLLYQPQMNMDLQLVGMEALIRWVSPEMGPMSPADFIPVAEETGMIAPIGAWALKEACRQSMEWRQAGYPRIKIAVNISARQLADVNFTAFVKNTLQETRMPADLLELELTESTLMDCVEDSLPRLKELRDLGITLSIDDFGTGYSSLSYLQKLPVSQVKIDQSFVREITAECKSTIPLIQAIIGLAHGMGHVVVAEGVETELQLHTLRVLGCDVVQGYLIRKPGSPSEVNGFLSGTKSSDLVELERNIRESGLGASVANEPSLSRR